MLEALKVFPAPAGINRRAALVFLTWRRVPRASGDKPFLRVLQIFST
ncbi:TPA: hypothetical protein IHO63_001556 [Escherichia coli]|nr:hypothetical protein [Escherichia coli]